MERFRGLTLCDYLKCFGSDDLLAFTAGVVMVSADMYDRCWTFRTACDHRRRRVSRQATGDTRDRMVPSFRQRAPRPGRMKNGRPFCVETGPQFFV